MDHGLKIEVLKDIMRSMMERDGSRIRPKEVEVELEAPTHSEPTPTHEAKEEDDMSDDDARTLEDILQGSSKDDDDEEEDQEAGLV